MSISFTRDELIALTGDPNVNIDQSNINRAKLFATYQPQQMQNVAKTDVENLSWSRAYTAAINGETKSLVSSLLIKDLSRQYLTPNHLLLYIESFIYYVNLLGFDALWCNNAATTKQNGFVSPDTLSCDFYISWAVYEDIN